MNTEEIGMCIARHHIAAEPVSDVQLLYANVWADWERKHERPPTGKEIMESINFHLRNEWGIA